MPKAGSEEMNEGADAGAVPFDQSPPSPSATPSAFDLKRCPWCGGPADIEEIGGKDGAPASFSVGCHDGDGESVCFGYQSLTSFARKSDAVLAWNRRACNAHSDMKEALEMIAKSNVSDFSNPKKALRIVINLARSALSKAGA